MQRRRGVVAELLQHTPAYWQLHELRRKCVVQHHAVKPQLRSDRVSC